MSGTYSDDDILRSMGAAVMLLLNGFDPETQFSQFQNLPVNSEGRVYYIDNTQQLPLFWGGLGFMENPGICIEGGQVKNCNYTMHYRKLIINLSELFINVEPEVVESQVEKLYLKVEPYFIGGARPNAQSAPIYTWSPSTSQYIITGVQGRQFWGERFTPIEIDTRLVTNLVPSGWIRKEIRLMTYYNR